MSCVFILFLCRRVQCGSRGHGHVSGPADSAQPLVAPPGLTRQRPRQDAEAAGLPLLQREGRGGRGQGADPAPTHRRGHADPQRLRLPAAGRGRVAAPAGAPEPAVPRVPAVCPGVYGADPGPGQPSGGDRDQVSGAARGQDPGDRGDLRGLDTQDGHQQQGQCRHRHRLQEGRQQARPLQQRVCRVR